MVMWHIMCMVAGATVAIVSGEGRATVNAAPFPLKKAVPGDFNMYLLAMTWQPELCFEQHDSFPGCLPGEKSLKPLTLHGLWPQNYDGTYPTACSNESFSFDDVLAAIPLKELEESWPNVKEDKRAAEYESFWEHEWSKHGTCTTLSQGMYFKTAVKMLEAVGTPDVMIWSGTGEAEREDIANFYGGDKMVLLECSHTYISQILLCFDKQEDDCVGDQIKCPEALLEKDNCPADSVNVEPSPHSAKAVS